MKNELNSGSIRALNTALSNELTAINQYILHARMMKNWGLLKLADDIQRGAITEMKHAERYVDRILFLEGHPDMQDLQQLRIGSDIQSCFANDLELEMAGHRDLVRAINSLESGDHSDFITREMFKLVLKDEEEHIDWLETQLALIERIGVERYQQAYIGN